MASDSFANPMKEISHSQNDFDLSEAGVACIEGVNDSPQGQVGLFF